MLIGKCHRTRVKLGRIGDANSRDGEILFHRMDRRELGAGEHMAGNSPAQAEAGPVTLIRRPFLASREIVKVVRWFESHRHLLLEDRATDTMEEVGNNR